MYRISTSTRSTMVSHKVSAHFPRNQRSHRPRPAHPSQSPPQKGRARQVSAAPRRPRWCVLPLACIPLLTSPGHLGKFTLSLHWMNLGNQPVEILVEDVYLLVVPSPQTSVDPEEDAKRIHAAKMERLESAELLHIRGQVEAQEGKHHRFRPRIAAHMSYRKDAIPGPCPVNHRQGHQQRPDHRQKYPHSL